MDNPRYRVADLRKQSAGYRAYLNMRIISIRTARDLVSYLHVRTESADIGIAEYFQFN